MVSNKEILMEAGTNEVEILIFGIGEERFGINVAKVREVIKLPKITKPPQTNPMIEGVMNLRDHIIPLVNLRIAMEYPVKVPQDSDRVIVSEYHQQWFGFIVDNVDTIVRISWKDIEPPPQTHHHGAILTGVAHHGEELILMLDVETLTEPLVGVLRKAHQAKGKSEKESSIIQQRESKRILAADDSGVIRTLVTETLKDAGYIQITVKVNGQEAWETLQQDANYALVITDIEMPQLDGLHLTKLIKTTEKTCQIPVVIFSSIISDDNRNKGDQVGADDQITKPEIDRLVQTVDRLLQVK
ncbi:MAG: chemotaxis protein [bacterium]|jgi:two-component system chemotaxis response regulator CheV|nr:chemotaxis protein [bacterium]